jgi:SAM-dependent methyltransferase
MQFNEQAAVWGKHSGQWSRVGPPLKPSPEDGALTLSLLQSAIDEAPGPCNIAVLGVTPELIQLAWPEKVRLEAFDHSAEMIAQVWKPHPAIHSQVRQADWRTLPLDTGTLHSVVGDGSFNVLPELEQYPSVFRELHRVLAAEGRMVIRCFIRPDLAEDVADVVDAVFDGQVGSFHALKWRLAMALTDAFSASVAVADIYEVFEANFPSRPQLSEATGWPKEQIDTIDAYRGLPTRYTFPTLSMMREQCQPWFDVAKVDYGTYELADRCPTLTLVRKNLGGVGE